MKERYKFIVYDTKQRKYVTDTYNLFDITQGYNIQFSEPLTIEMKEALEKANIKNIACYELVDFSNWYFNNLIMEQYTTFNDINNKNIFEGDIVKYTLVEKFFDKKKYNNMIDDISLQREFGKNSGKTLFDYDIYCIQESTIEKEVIYYCEVRFDNGHFYLKKEDNHWQFCEVCSNGTLEIIGNIHDKEKME